MVINCFCVICPGIKLRFYNGAKISVAETGPFYSETINDHMLKTGLTVNNTQINAGDIVTYNFTCYFGQQDLDLLKSHKAGFEEIMSFSSFSILDGISKVILKLMHFIYRVIPNW